MYLTLRRTMAAALVVAFAAGLASASKGDALRLTRNIRAHHMPFGTIVDPVFASPESAEIVGYSRGGDSAIWTGHYVAAEAFRYRTTGSRKALANVWAGLRGIKDLVDVTGIDVLARCKVPVEWEETVDARSIITEEAGHGVYRGVVGGEQNYWIGDTSRDQYSGVFFGLSVAYDLVDESRDAAVRPFVRELVTRMLDNLLANDWVVRMPDGRISTIFTGRFDQQLALLQLGRVVNPSRFGAVYADYRDSFAAVVAAPILVDCADTHESYFKFNLDYINLYVLISHEDRRSTRRLYKAAYKILRSTTESHENAHFNMIDRALNGPKDARDVETVNLLEAWLERPSRDEWVDLRCCVPACGDDRACEPIPVADAVRTDFLWQRSPFLLYGGGAGTIETAGIDYLLPYWMARYYGIPA